MMINMTLSPWIIYFADIADSIVNLFLSLAWITLTCSILIWLGYYEALDEYHGSDRIAKILKPLRWIMPIICIVFSLITTFTPSTQTVYKMMIIPPIVNSKVVQKLPDELQKYMDKVLSTKEDK